jgi:hypothetical protein
MFPSLGSREANDLFHKPTCRSGPLSFKLFGKRLKQSLHVGKFLPQA